MNFFFFSLKAHEMVQQHHLRVCFHGVLNGVALMLCSGHIDLFCPDFISGCADRLPGITACVCVFLLRCFFSVSQTHGLVLLCSQSASKVGVQAVLLRLRRNRYLNVQTISPSVIC